VFDLEFSEKGGLRGFFQQLGKEINTLTNQKHDAFATAQQNILIGRHSLHP